ncbi:MAG: hypothetical protein JSU74_00365, partial [Candidatus Zixiibacteriota bacterium]
MARSKTQKKALAALNYDLFQPESMVPPSPATIHTKIREHSAAATRAEVDRFPATAGKLPSVDELQRMFDLTNWLYFEG